MLFSGKVRKTVEKYTSTKVSFARITVETSDDDNENQKQNLNVIFNNSLNPSTFSRSTVICSSPKSNNDGKVKCRRNVNCSRIVGFNLPPMVSVLFSIFWYFL